VSGPLRAIPFRSVVVWVSAWQAAVFVIAAAISLRSSEALVSRLERLGERVRLTEAMLGLVAALCADMPEITSAVAALVRGQKDVGVGVVLGASVMNLATLLGLGALLSGRIALHLRVVVFDGVVGLWMVAGAIVIVTGAVGPGGGLALVLPVFAAYVAVSAAGGRRLARLPVPRRWRNWLVRALREEEHELSVSIRPVAGGAADARIAAAALLVVVAASVAMEYAGTALGARLGLPDIIVGSLLLAAVTSLPNAVAAVHLARRGRGAAALATTLNSNSLNVMAGLMLPAVVVGLGAGTRGATWTAWWLAGLTLLCLAFAYAGRGLGRRAGAAIIAGYAAFVVVLVMVR